jgi:hypothetical protein
MSENHNIYLTKFNGGVPATLLGKSNFFLTIEIGDGLSSCLQLRKIRQNANC